ncbi:MAG: hypothetical protein JJ979_08470 [Roseibium sp.]|nr:hypothetical protein [Roseibium sp.]
MRFYPMLFWLAAIVVIVWSGWTYINFAVVEFYHPFSSRGDLLWSFKKTALLLPALLAAGVFLLWLRQRPLKSRVYQYGIAFLAVATALPWFPKIDSEFRQEYWLAETRHDIPWQFAPFGGNPDPGGKSFLIRVSLPDLEPEYGTSDPTVIVGKSVVLDSFHGGAETLIEPCESHSASRRMPMAAWRLHLFGDRY